MGHCYDTRTGAMVCDMCGKADGTTRTRRCPHGYCPGADMCAECWASEEMQRKWKAWHIEHHCEQGAREWREHEQKERELVEAGEALRIAALGIGDNAVHVLFRLAGDKTIGRFMHRDTYHAFPLLRPTTLKEYEATEGRELIEAPATFH